MKLPKFEAKQFSVFDAAVELHRSVHDSFTKMLTIIEER